MSESCWRWCMGTAQQSARNSKVDDGLQLQSVVSKYGSRLLLLLILLIIVRLDDDADDDCDQIIL